MKAALVVSILLVALWVVPSALAQAPTTTVLALTLSQDSWTQSDLPDTNHGSDADVQGGQNGIGPFYHTLIEWDMSPIPTNALILDANLTVENVDTGTSSFEVRVRAITASWTDSTVTWNNEPGHSAILDTFIQDVENPGSFSHNITNSVQALIGTSTFGLKFLNDSTPNKFFDWRSSEHGVGPAPNLTVTYETPGAIDIALNAIIALLPIIIILGVAGGLIIGLGVKYGFGSSATLILFTLTIVGILILLILLALLQVFI